MRVLANFMIILVLGFCSSVIAKRQTDNIGEPSHSAVFGFTPEETEGLGRENCEKNGGPTAYSRLTEGWENFLDCIGPLLDTTELTIDRAAVDFEGNWDKFVKKYCHRLPKVVQCVRYMVDSTMPCLDAEDKEIVGRYHDILSSLMEFMCQNDGSLLKSFFNAAGVQCLTSKMDTIEKDCGSESSADETNNESIESQIPWIEIVRKECAVIEKFGTCTVEVLRTCENSAPANVFESVFTFFKNRNSCPNSTSQAQTSPAA